MRSGYQTAITMAEEILSKLNPDDVIRRTGAEWTGNSYLIPWFNEKLELKSGSEAERVLWLHYLISEGTQSPTGQLIAYRELKDAGFYESKFIERAVNPFVKHFAKKPEQLCRIGVALGGVGAEWGDYSVSLSPLPNVPLTYILWAGDEELPADGTILFDKTASGQLPAEDLTVLAQICTYRLIRNILTPPYKEVVASRPAAAQP